MQKHIITIPLSTDMDPSDLLEYALEFGDALRRRTGEKVVQDEENTTVETMR